MNAESTYQDVTIDEFEAFITRAENQERRFELVHGEIVEKMPSYYHALISSLLTTFLTVFVLERKLDDVLSEARYRLSGDEHNARIPDVSFVHKERQPKPESGPIPYMPDLAVKVQSPDDSPKAMRSKADYYLAHGTRLVWLVFPAARRVEVYALHQSPQMLDNDGTLDGGDVLPGFTLSLADLFSHLPDDAGDHNE